MYNLRNTFPVNGKIYLKFYYTSNLCLLEMSENFVIRTSSYLSMPLVYAISKGGLTANVKLHFFLYSDQLKRTP